MGSLPVAPDFQGLNEADDIGTSAICPADLFHRLFGEGLPELKIIKVRDFEAGMVETCCFPRNIFFSARSLASLARGFAEVMDWPYYEYCTDRKVTEDRTLALLPPLQASILLPTHLLAPILAEYETRRKIKDTEVLQ